MLDSSHTEHFHHHGRFYWTVLAVQYNFSVPWFYFPFPLRDSWCFAHFCVGEYLFASFVFTIATSLVIEGGRERSGLPAAFLLNEDSLLPFQSVSSCLKRCSASLTPGANPLLRTTEHRSGSSKEHFWDLLWLFWVCCLRLRAPLWPLSPKPLFPPLWPSPSYVLAWFPPVLFLYSFDAPLFFIFLAPNISDRLSVPFSFSHTII